KLIERALRPEQFRLLVVQYNHLSLSTELEHRLKERFSERPFHHFNGRNQSPEEFLGLMEELPTGIVLVHHFESWLNEEAFLRSINQRRDKLSRHALGLVLLLPTGGNYLKQLSRRMPDLWSLRNLVAELIQPHQAGSGGQFMTDTGRSYLSFSSKEEIEAEIDSLSHRMEELKQLPGNKALLVSMYNRLGKLRMGLGDYQVALDFFLEAVKLAREIDDQMALAIALTELGETYQHLGQLDQAMRVLEESLSIQREIGDRSGEGSTLNNISQIYDAKGDYDTALRYLEQSLEIQQQIGDVHGLAATLNNTGAIIFQQQADPERALPLFIRSYSIFKQIGSPNEGVPMSYIQDIIGEIGEARFQEIFSEIQDREVGEADS
ncbi:MAG: tetratricopeptide repeat protein, partial [Bacteroidota bacterium]